MPVDADLPKWTRIRSVCRREGVPLLCLLALAEGSFDNRKLDPIVLYAKAALAEDGISINDREETKLKAYIMRARITDKLKHRILKKLSSASPETVVRLVRAGLAVISADGVVGTEEEALLRSFYKTITGKTF